MVITQSTTTDTLKGIKIMRLRITMKKKDARHTKKVNILYHNTLFLSKMECGGVWIQIEDS